MSEEYIYDKQRLMKVVAIILIVVSGSVILYTAWPQEQPKIGDVASQLNFYTDNETIAEKYSQIFGGSINTNETIMLKIYVQASTIYYMDRMSISIEVGEDMQLLAVAVVRSSNEADVLTGKNDFVVGQKIYSNIIELLPDNFMVYVFLTTSSAIDFYYNVRVLE
jgi:hypothetical protein